MDRKSIYIGCDEGMDVAKMLIRRVYDTEDYDV